MTATAGHTHDARRVRQRLGHTIIDGDAHHVEVSVAFADFVREHGGGRYLDDSGARVDGLFDSGGNGCPRSKTVDGFTYQPVRSGGHRVTRSTTPP